eukprot:55676-Eustigmatos_ZCMA.PRE.1
MVIRHLQLFMYNDLDVSLVAHTRRRPWHTPLPCPGQNLLCRASCRPTATHRATSCASCSSARLSASAE